MYAHVHLGVVCVIAGTFARGRLIRIALGLDVQEQARPPPKETTISASKRVSAKDSVTTALPKIEFSHRPDAMEKLKIYRPRYMRISQRGGSENESLIKCFVLCESEK